MIDANGLIHCECEWCKSHLGADKAEVLGRVENNVLTLQARRHGITHSITLNGYVLLATGLKTVDINDRRGHCPQAVKPDKPLGAPGRVGSPLSLSGRQDSGVKTLLKI